MRTLRVDFQPSEAGEEFEVIIEQFVDGKWRDVEKPKVIGKEDRVLFMLDWNERLVIGAKEAQGSVGYDKEQNAAVPRED
jgi:hypothetical protein